MHTTLAEMSDLSFLLIGKYYTLNIILKGIKEKKLLTTSHMIDCIFVVPLLFTRFRSNRVVTTKLYLSTQS